MTRNESLPIYLLKGGSNSHHKRLALQDLVKNTVIPVIVNAIEPDYHEDPLDLTRAKFDVFSNAWSARPKKDHIRLAGDVTSSLGNEPVRKSASKTLADLALEITDRVKNLPASTEPEITFDEHSSIMAAKGFNDCLVTAHTQVQLPTKALLDKMLVKDYLDFSELSLERLLNMSGGIDLPSLLVFLDKNRLLGGKSIQEVVSLPDLLRRHANDNPGYASKRLGFYEEIGHLPQYLYDRIDIITLLALLESAHNIPGFLVTQLAHHFNNLITLK